jgi:hypothetical protein
LIVIVAWTGGHFVTGRCSATLHLRRTYAVATWNIGVFLRWGGANIRPAASCQWGSIAGNPPSQMSVKAVATGSRRNQATRHL